MKKLILIVAVVLTSCIVQAQSQHISKSPKAIRSSIGEFVTESAQALPQRDYTLKVSKTKDGGTLTLLKFDQPENPVEIIPVKSKIKIYPNPATDKLLVTLQPAAPASYALKIFNLLGVMVKSLELNPAETEIDISDFRQGIYFLRCYTGSEVQTIRLIKE